MTHICRIDQLYLVAAFHVDRLPYPLRGKLEARLRSDDAGERRKAAFATIYHVVKQVAADRVFRDTWHAARFLHAQSEGGDGVDD